MADPTTPKDWRVTRDKYDDDADVHVTPNRDDRDHELARSCWCVPFLDRESRHVTVIHHSLDGREFSEPDHRNLEQVN